MKDEIDPLAKLDNASLDSELQRLVDQYEQTGSIREDGQFNMRIGTDRDNKKVIVDFGKKVIWIAMTIDECQNVVDILNQKISDLRKMP